MTHLQAVIDFFNSHISQVILRKDLIPYVHNRRFDVHKTDILRRYLTCAKFVKRIGFGKYIAVKAIPEMTEYKLFKLAYPKRKS